MPIFTQTLHNLQQNLNILREREAKYGGDAPTALLNQIRDHEQAIALTGQAQRDEISGAAWREQLRPLLVEIQKRTGEAAAINISDIADSVINIGGSVLANIEAGGDVVGGDKVEQTAHGSNIAQASHGGQATVNVTDQRGQQVHGDQYNAGRDIINNYYQAYPQPAPHPDPTVIAAAKEVLAQLPTDTIPNVATLPPGSRMPYPPNPHFVGRETELKALAGLLKGGQTAAIGQIAAATGLGGIGKSQLAAAFAHRYGRYFAGGVFWLNFAAEANFELEIAQAGEGLQLHPQFLEMDIPDRAKLVRQAWQSALPRLLIFDNCEDESLVQRYRPPTGGARVLLTSRRSQWSRSLGIQRLPLATLPRPESIKLLLKFRPDLIPSQPPPARGRSQNLSPNSQSLTPNPLNAIAEAVGDLPLALHLAGSYLARYADNVTPAQYLADLQAINPLNHPSLQGRQADASPTQHELHAANTFALSYDRLQADDPIDALALKLLARAACLAPGQPIPRDLLLATVEAQEKAETDDPQSAIRNDNPRSVAEWGSQFDLADALRRLTDLGLLETPARHRLTLHRLLAAFVRQTNPDPVAQDTVERTLLQLASESNNSQDPNRILTWQVHLRHITNRLMGKNSKIEVLLCNKLALHLNTISQLQEALFYFEHGYQAALTVLGERDQRTLTIKHNMAGALWDMGNLERAAQLLGEIAADCERELGQEHADTLGSINALAVVLSDLGDYEGARPLLERALAISEGALGPEHPQTAQTLNNLALLLYEQGDYEGARPLYERALAISERALGPEHPQTAGSLNNLAGLHRQQGNYEGARPLYERALAISERALGPEHPQTAQTLNNLAELHRQQGNYEGARPLYERALAISERALGPEHPQTAASLLSLAELHRQQGNYEGARPLYERALAISERALGPEHPQTAQTLNNLAGLHRQQGNHEGARPLYERALAISERALGPEHPQTAASLLSLAELHRQQGNYEGARPLYERALAISERALGPEHPQTAASLNNLALLLYEQGDYEGARPLYERALAISERALGPEHPQTAGSLNNLAGLLYEQGNYEGARPLYERALAISERALGPEHPQTAASLLSLAELHRQQGNYEGARPLYERALAISERALGPEHPQTAGSLNNLAGLHRQQGNYEGARPLYERALAISERALGPEHPQTALSLNNLALLLYEQGDYEGARPLYERALAISERALGPEHPQTAGSLNNLAGLHRQQGNYEGARPLYERALAISERALGPEHPQTALSLNNLALLLYEQGDYEGARPLYERALAISERALGPEHPQTRTVRRNLSETQAVLAHLDELEQTSEEMLKMKEELLQAAKKLRSLKPIDTEENETDDQP